MRRHEDGHVDAYVETAREVAAELNALSASGSDANPRAVQAAAARARLAEATRRIGGTTLRDRANASARAYDARNGHGRSQGAVLDTSIT